jgi:GNAT superfamily N-acetyltransferase
MVLIRDFRPGDASAVHDMMQRLAAQRKESSHQMVLKDEYARFFPAYLESFLKDKDSVMKIAEDGGNVVGYAIATRAREAAFYKYSKVARLSDVFVADSHRKKGAGHALLDALCDWAKKNGLQAIEVDVFPDHVQEIQGLEGLGFFQYRVKLLRPLDEASRMAQKSVPKSKPK